ncbi:MAG TPA: hypothetical protein ENK10_06900 [Acidobacteria bacterium]|nr:hypothetical protein [Acidobacteriota bacterium]
MPKRKAGSTSSSTTAVASTFAAAEKAYASAMKLFAVKRDFAAAQQAFEAFIEQFNDDDSLLELVDRARSHLAACRLKTSPPSAAPSTGAEWLTLAVVLSNEGRVDEALETYEKALASGAEEAKVYYARATTLAAAERNDEALESLKMAIAADPENRNFALGDPDFERLRELAGFVELVEPPRSAGTGPEEVDQDGPETEPNQGF